MIQWITETLASAASSAALLALAVYLLRHLLIERLKRSIAHEYDTRLEALRSDHLKLIEEIREVRAEREAFRSLVFSMLTSAQAAVAERKMQAIEVLWQSFYEIRKQTPYYIFIADMLGYKMHSLGEKVRAEMKQTDVVSAVKPLLLDTDKVAKIRPFLSEQSYALFHATSSFFGRATSTTLSSIQKGELRLWYEEVDTKELLASVLSESELSTFGELKHNRLDWLVRRLEMKLVQAIRDEINGSLTVHEAIQKAHAILIASEVTRNTVETSGVPA